MKSVFSFYFGQRSLDFDHEALRVLEPICTYERDYFRCLYMSIVELGQGCQHSYSIPKWRWSYSLPVYRSKYFLMRLLAEELLWNHNLYDFGDLAGNSSNIGQ